MFPGGLESAGKRKSVQEVSWPKLGLDGCTYCIFLTTMHTSPSKDAHARTRSCPARLLVSNCLTMFAGVSIFTN